jgi:hypothetical protein
MIALLAMLPQSALAGEEKQAEDGGERCPPAPLMHGRPAKQLPAELLASVQPKTPRTAESRRTSSGLVTLKPRDPVAPAEDRQLRDPWLAAHPAPSVSPQFEPPDHLPPPVLAFSVRTRRPLR